MRRYLPDFAIFALLFLLPLVMFWPQTMGGRTLLPTENLYQYEPYATYREVVRAPDVPHNHLLSDLVLQNMQWKLFIRESIAQGEIPLWNPYQFSGIPFLAAGQQSALYPFSLIYYVLPLPAAYGWFTVVQMWLAGVFMVLFMRGLSVGRFGAVCSGVIYQLSAFFVINAVFPMIMAAAVWLPLLLMMIEYILRQRLLLGRPSSVPWAAIGAVALGCNIFAGHVEITYYTLLIMAYYAAARLLVMWWHGSKTSPPAPLSASRERENASRLIQLLLTRVGWLAVMVALGIGLGAAQFLPLFEFANVNWRSERGSIDQVLSYAHPPRDALQFALPNFYGNPAHHTYFDWFTLETAPVTVNAYGEAITHTEWGMKNYVEGALYVGILPLALAAFAVFTAFRPPLPVGEGSGVRAYILIFGLLALLGLTFMFGLPTYRLVYLLPGINQLNTPFRWIFAVTFSVAVLAGFGVNALAARDRLARRCGAALMIAGVGILGGLALSRVFYAQIEPFIVRLLESMATPDGRTAASRFADAPMFYSYQFTNVLIFGLFTLGAGVVFWWAGRGRGERAHHAAPLQAAVVALIAADLMIASWGFNPASDPALLDFTPPAIEWLQAQPGHWRYITLQDPNQPPLLNANMTWHYGLRDVRGYESIIPSWYVDYMRQAAPQPQLDFNRVAPLYTDQLEQVDWVRLALLGVRYIITPRSMHLNDYLPRSRDPRDGRELPLAEPVYEDEAVRIWGSYDLPYAYVALVLEGRTLSIEEGVYIGQDVIIEGDTGREKTLHAIVADVPEAWLVVSETYMPGWRAYVRPHGGDTERPLPVEQVLGVFQGVNVTRGVLAAAFADVYDDLPPEQQAALDEGQISVRLVYSPQSFQLGFFGSFISGVLVLFMLGIWLWRRYVAPESDDSGTVKRVARNSLAPIILNLFNRGIDFAFAAVMLRVLGPADAGLYQYAIVIFVWFDIFTNFGLNTFLTREVARDRSRAGYYFLNTSALRLALIVIGVLPLVGFLGARQALVTPALDSTALLALGLLYLGLLPNSLSTGMTALFYAFEKAEYPSAVSTIATINKAVFGVAVLALGYGIVGLAAVSIVTNVLTLAVLMYGGRGLLRLFPHPKSLSHEGRGTSNATAPPLPGNGRGGWGVRVNPSLMRGMVGESWPLMVNHFLATIFFQIDVVLIEFIRGARMVGLYSVAYKWVAAINVIPAFFTMAMLPVMSRQAQEDREALKRTYVLAIKLLTAVALPLAVLFTFLAHDLTWLLGGMEYLPDSAIATQLMIWSIPFGWINSLTQYVLIALDLQRRITGAFIIAVTFNIVTNLIFIPQYGYQAAAITTIASEMMLLLPFGILLTRAVGRLNWLEMLWRQVVAAGVMLCVMWVSWAVSPVGAVAAGLVIYPIALLLLRPLSADETGRLLPLLPQRLRPASARLFSR